MRKISRDTNQEVFVCNKTSNKWRLIDWIDKQQKELIIKDYDLKILNISPKVTLIDGENEYLELYSKSVNSHKIIEDIKNHIKNFSYKNKICFDLCISIGKSGAFINSHLNDGKSDVFFEKNPKFAYFSESFLHFPMKRPILPNVAYLNSEQKKKLNICVIDSVLKTGLSLAVAIYHIRKALKLANVEINEIYFFTVQGRVRLLIKNIIKGNFKEDQEKSLKNLNIEENPKIPHSIEDVIFSPIYILKEDWNKPDKFDKDRFEVYQSYRKSLPDFCGSHLSMISSVLTQINENGCGFKELPDKSPSFKFYGESIIYRNPEMREKTKKTWDALYDKLKRNYVLKDKKNKLKSAFDNLIQIDMNIQPFLNLYWDLRYKLKKEELDLKPDYIDLIDYFILLFERIFNVVKNIQPVLIAGSNLSSIIVRISAMGKEILRKIDEKDEILKILMQLSNYVVNNYQISYEKSLVEYYCQNKIQERSKKIKDDISKMYNYFDALDEWQLISNPIIFNEIGKFLSKKIIDKISSENNSKIILIVDKISSIVLAAKLEKILQSLESSKNFEIQINFMRNYNKFIPEIESEIENTNFFYIVPKLYILSENSLVLQELKDKNITPSIIGIINHQSRNLEGDLNLIENCEKIFFWSSINKTITNKIPIKKDFHCPAYIHLPKNSVSSKN